METMIPGKGTPIHRHNCEEVWLILSGTATVSIRDLVRMRAAPRPPGMRRAACLPMEGYGGRAYLGLWRALGPGRRGHMIDRSWASFLARPFPTRE